VTGRDPTLRRLVTAVTTMGVAAIAGALLLLNQDLGGRRLWLLPALVALVAVCSAAVVRVRLHSTVAGTAWTDAGILICIVWLPRGWVPLCVGVGVLAAKLIFRVPRPRAAYNAAKDALSATAGLAVASALGVAATGPNALAHLGALVLVGATVVIAENLIGVPVIALASNTSWRQVLCRNGDIKVAAFAGKLAVAILTLRLLQENTRLLAVIPPVALCLHLLYAGRVQARDERFAWQRLATTAEGLNSTDLREVGTTAVTNAARLFAAEEVEVFLRDVPLLVRGDADGVTYCGDPASAPPAAEGESLSARLTVRLDEDAIELGEIRLRYAGRIRLSDRDRLVLRTFVSSLRTAVRNAAAFAETRRLAERNAHAALHDPLTGLANRRHMHEYGAARLAAGVALLVVVLDLDRFREVNETLGHKVGDQLLVEVSRRLSRVVGPDDLVARISGDEFGVLLVGRTEAESDGLVRALLGSLDAPVNLGGPRVRVEATAAVATAAPPTTEEPESAVIELLRRADVTMYQAKRVGRRTATYVPEFDTTDVSQLMLGGDLPRAVAEREFTVLFQPIVDLATGQMVAAEALARWHHPEQGDLDPRRFLAAVERSDLLPAFADAVLDQALAAMRRWKAAGVDAPVAVNASPRSLLDQSYVALVTARLAAHGARGGDLVIELTESLTPGQVDLIGEVLGSLRTAGVRFALDDFGTGFSSLSLLAKVPVYELKIDRSFVGAMGSAAEAAAVVRSTIDLGRSLELMVVAEGVETDEQRAALVDLGCAAGQGHLFARPMTADALLEILSAAPVTGRLSEPLHGSAGNVIDLPRTRRPETEANQQG
jgi:diguanylate cyclase (GGDEF)-like protein